MDLNKLVTQSIEKMSENGEVQKIIENKVAKTIESIVDDVFGSWSNFSKSLKKEIEDQIQINLKELDIPSYNTFIMAAVKEKLNDSIAEQGVTRINETIDELLSNVKDEYKLSDLVKELAEEFEDIDELGYEDYHEMSMHIDQPYGLKYIYLDAESDKKKYDCKYRICVSPEKENEINSIEIRDDKYGSTRTINSFDARAIMRGFYGLEETLFKMYARKSKLIIDEDQVELNISNPEYD